MERSCKEVSFLSFIFFFSFCILLYLKKNFFYFFILIKNVNVYVYRSKKIIVSANAISRVIGRGGANINAIRDASGAHIEVEKQKGSGDRLITIK